MEKNQKCLFSTNRHKSTILFPLNEPVKLFYAILSKVDIVDNGLDSLVNVVVEGGVEWLEEGSTGKLWATGYYEESQFAMDIVKILDVVLPKSCQKTRIYDAMHG